MKTIQKNACIIFALLLMCNPIFAQSNKQKAHLGLGLGLDHGGFGVKLEYLPVKHFGIFGGFGYNLLSSGWNVGATYKILPEKKVSPNLMLFYGYNGVMKIEDMSEYDMTSYGVTLGGNIDIMLGNKGNKLTIGLFVPIRSSKFMDNYNDAKDNPKIEFKSELLPIAISIGYNILL